MCYCNPVVFNTKINNCCKACTISLPTWGENKWGAKFLRHQWNSQNIISERPLKLFHIIKTVKAIVYRGQSCYEGVSTKLRTWSTCMSYSQTICWRIPLLSPSTSSLQPFLITAFTQTRKHNSYELKKATFFLQLDWITCSHLLVNWVPDKALLNNSIHSSPVTVAQVRNW